MQVQFEPSEVELVVSLLDSSLGNLRMEIGKTENFDMRNDLKRREDSLKTILARLKNAAPAA